MKQLRFLRFLKFALLMLVVLALHIGIAFAQGAEPVVTVWYVKLMPVFVTIGGMGFGWMVKNWTKIPNKWIPYILGLLGILLPVADALFGDGSTFGALTPLYAMAATGFHQLYNAMNQPKQLTP